MSAIAGQKTLYWDPWTYGLHDDLMEHREAVLAEKHQADLVAKYQRSAKAARDMLWIKHRNLRGLFDEIEKEADSMAGKRRRIRRGHSVFYYYTPVRS